MQGDRIDSQKTSSKTV